MASILVRRDQFNITPQGIVHKPTDAALPHTLATHILGSRAWVNLAANILMEMVSGQRMYSG